MVAYAFAGECELNWRRSFWLWLHARFMTSYWHMVVYGGLEYGCVEAWMRGDSTCGRATGGLAGTAQKIFGRRICWSELCDLIGAWGVEENVFDGFYVVRKKARSTC